MYSYVSNPPTHFFHLGKVLFFGKGVWEGFPTCQGSLFSVQLSFHLIILKAGMICCGHRLFIINIVADT